MHTYAIFTALYRPHMGGVEAYCEGLAHELVARGERVIVVTLRLSSDAEAHEMQHDGVEVLRLPCTALMNGRLPMPRRNAEHSAMLAELERAKPDRVVLNNHFYAHTLDGAAFARRVGAQAIVVEHGSAYLTLGNGVADRAVRAYEHAMAKRVKSYGFPFACVSSKAAEWARTFGFDVAGVVPNAIDARAYEENARSESFREELGLSDDDLLVASVGRLVPEKGVDVLLEAARIVREGSVTDLAKGRKCLFAFAGAGPLQESVRFAGDNVVSLGRLDAGEVAALLRDCDAYVLPSRSEGFATSLLEACSMGAFPMAADVGGVDELGIGRIGGIVLPDAAAPSVVASLEIVANQRSASRHQAEALQESVRNRNTWAATADALERVFVVGASNAHAPAIAEEPFEGDERLDQLHRVLLMMMKDFAAICEREGIEWMINYGSAIGALRHGGFIPWDDDVDICMLRADHDRFIDAVRADEAGKYSIVTAQTHPGYPLATTRFMLNGTEFRDSALATMDFPSGIFIDLFPLDALSDDEGTYRRQIYGAWFFNKLAIAKLTRNPFIVAEGAMGAAMGAAATATRIALNAPGIRKLDPNATARKLLAECDGEQTRRVGFPCDTVATWCVYDADDLFPLRWVPFEDMTVPVPNRVEDLLTELYGDWMQLPSNDVRTAHYPDILDFGDYADI